jgi:hypothetical protein
MRTAVHAPRWLRAHLPVFGCPALLPVRPAIRDPRRGPADVSRAWCDCPSLTRSAPGPAVSQPLFEALSNGRKFITQGTRRRGTTLTLPSVAAFDRCANPIARIRRKALAVSPAPAGTATLTLPPRSNRRPRWLVLGLVFLITGANVASAIAVMHESSVRTRARPAAVRPWASHYQVRQGRRLP